MKRSPKAHLRHFRHVVTYASILSMLSACSTPTEPIAVVQPFNAARYVGTWNEIARIDNRFQQYVVGATAHYSQNPDGSIHVINKGFSTQTQRWEQAEGTATFVESKDIGRLKVTFFWPFSGGYNIVSISDDYQHALVVGDSPDYAWLLSRKTDIPETIQQHFLQQAKLLGVNTKQLLWDKQRTAGLTMTTIHDFTANSLRGATIDFSDYKGKVLLIVNTASKCGLVGQYQELEELYQKYRDQGLVIIGFPSNQFGNQEPGNSEEISEFCQLNYGVSFQMMEKIDVNGNDAHPIYQWLKSQRSNFFGSSIKWNFTKFLVAADGTVIGRYSPLTKPKSLQLTIEAALKEATNTEMPAE